MTSKESVRSMPTLPYLYSELSPKEEDDIICLLGVSFQCMHLGAHILSAFLTSAFHNCLSFIFPDFMYFQFVDCLMYPFWLAYQDDSMSVPSDEKSLRLGAGRNLSHL